MHARRSLIRAAVLASLATANGLAHAQTQPQSQLEEVVVTAQKRAQGANDVGITVNTFTAEQLANQGVRSATDLEVLTPGLTVTEAAPTGVPVYTIRGVGFSDFSTASSSTVGLYVDEVSIPYAVMSRGVLFDLERVEVLKGPQGDLYGRNTTAGQINFIPRKPTSEFEAGVQLGFARFETLEFEGYVSGPLSERVRARLATKIVRSNEGWQESISRPGDRLGERDEIAVRALADIDLTPAATLSLNVHWSKDRGDNQAPTAYDGTLIGRPASQPLPTALDATPYFSTGNSRLTDWSPALRPTRDDELKGVAAKLTWHLSDALDLTSITGYDEFERFDRFELSGLPFQDGVTDNGTDLKVFSQELRLSSADDGPVYWLAGVHYSHDELAELYDMYMADSFFGFALGINTLDTRYEQKTESVAGFGHVEWEFAERFKLTGGLRYTSEKRRWSGCTYDTGDGSLAFGWNNILTPFTILANGLPDPGLVPPGGCAIYDDIAGTPGFGTFGVFSDRIKTEKWMWKTTLDWKPNDDVLLYGTVSTGFKSGGYNGAQAQTHSQLLPYKAETLTSYELGVKSTLLESRLQLNLSTFYYDYKDKQEPTLAVTPVGNIAGLTNVPKSEVKGAELELRWLVVPGLTFDLGVTRVDTKVKEYTAIDPASVWPNVITFDAAGNELANAPNWQLNASLDYVWSVSDRLQMFVGADAAYKDDTSGSVQDLVSDYTLVNARVGVKSADDRWTAKLWARNVFDEHYWTAAFGSNGTFVRMNGMPATWGIALGYRF